MKPSAFEYFDPSTVREAVELLQRHSDDAKILAGGQSLIPMMNFPGGPPQGIDRYRQIKELDYIREDKAHW